MKTNFIACLLGEEIYTFDTFEEMQSHIDEHGGSVDDIVYADYSCGRCDERYWPTRAHIDEKGAFISDEK